MMSIPYRLLAIIIMILVIATTAQAQDWRTPRGYDTDDPTRPFWEPIPQFLPDAFHDDRYERGVYHRSSTVWEIESPVALPPSPSDERIIWRDESGVYERRRD